MALLIYDNGILVRNPSPMEAPPRQVAPAQETPAATATAAHNPQPQTQQPTGQETANTPAPAPQTQRPPVGPSKFYQNTGKQSDSLQNRRKLSAQHVMSSPAITIGPYTTLSDAWEKMQAESIQHLVVVNGQDSPLGVITALDLLLHERSDNSFVEILLDKPLMAASLEMLVRDIALTFIEQHITALPVVDAEHQVRGIICRSDLLHLLVSGPNLEQRA